MSTANDVDPSIEFRVHPDMPPSDVNLKVQDEGRLAELGYTQELRREWSLLHNFGASFSIIVSHYCTLNIQLASRLMRASFRVW